MKSTKVLAVLAAIIVAAGVPARTLAADAASSATPPDNGANSAPAYPAAPAFSPGTDYSLQDMLTYALQAEYRTEAATLAVTARFGAQPLFTELQTAAAERILLLKGLFERHDTALPVNTAADEVSVPSSLRAAYNAGLKAEKLKVQMYEAFLARSLPDDVREAFEQMLEDARETLALFEQAAAQYPYGDDRDRDDGDDDDDDDDAREGHGEDGDDDDDDAREGHGEDGDDERDDDD